VAAAGIEPLESGIAMPTRSNIRAFEGRRPELGARVYLDPAALLIGAVSVGDDASLWPFAVARGDVNEIVIGARSNVQDNTVLHVTHDGPFSKGGRPLVVGEDVTVGHQCILHACTIGDRVLVGMGSVVMDGVVVETDVLIAAGSLVPPHKRLQRGYLYQGRPATRSRALTDAELELLCYSAQHYVRLKDRHLASPA
jgi:carbonic anhydrase/acetyltransferase-like protein (isoleucine patch superfamily)